MSEGEVVMGQYNTSYNNSGNSWDATDRLFTLGNGTSISNRQDALVIYKSGDAVFSGSISAANLYSKPEVDQSNH
ncbi:MAG: hypothetical protein U5L96_10820 [Owenweeksia sp.]|nr:hypothetical protein [Owenweeksia sp.]